MRLFIAIPVPAAVVRALSQARAQLEKGGATGRFVPEGNYHVTMKFIGESNDLNGAARGMRAAVIGARPIPLRLDQYGFFPGGTGHTGFVSVEDLTGGELLRLYEMLEGALRDEGFGRGQGKFVPHITLGRALAGDTFPIAVRKETFTASSLVLYESRSERGNLRYDPLHREAF